MSIVKTPYVGTAGLLLAIVVTGCGLFDPEFSSDPGSAAVVSEDIGRFWEAFDAAYADGVSANERVERFDRLYLDPGTKGLDEFVRRRIESASRLASAVTSAQQYYAAIRPTTLLAMSVETEADVRAILAAMKSRYDDAVFPDVYFLVGRLSTGGTLTEVGIIIGVELFSRIPGTPVEELSPWGQQVTRGPEYLPAIVAHELVHAQQQHPGGGDVTLLAAAITEGMADFVGEILSGTHVNAHVHAYANPVEHRIWEEFQADMMGTDRSAWMNNGTQIERPADLGYYVGYKISEAFYAQFEDKAQALREMFAVTDYEDFLSRSGYNP